MLGDEDWMERALAAARAVRGTTAPNPPVGAVIVADGKVIGVGATRPVGGPHAEVVALEEAAGRARGATLYVTLEPCCHHGRTPPCTDAVLAAGIVRVVVGVLDPFPLVDGRGVAQLRSAGVDVSVGAAGPASAALVAGFTRAVREGLPEVVTGDDPEHTLDAVVVDRPRDCTAMTLVVRSPRNDVDADALAAARARERVVWCTTGAPQRPGIVTLRADDEQALLRALVDHGRHRVRFAHTA